jgi:cytochrome b561
MNNPQRYTKVAIILHWLIAIMIFGMLAVGFYMSELPKDAPKLASFDLFDLGVYMVQLQEAVSPRSYYFNLHKSFGVTVLALVLLRVLWKLTHKAPTLPDNIPAWQKKVAHASHHLLYVLMLVMPLSGLTMATFSKYGVIWFGIPLIEGLGNDAMRDVFKEVHGVTAILLVALIALHILAALKHRLINKDDVMGRMTSFK